MSTLTDVFTALVGAYHDIELSSGERLQSSTFKSEALPRILWKVQGWASENWQPFMYRIVWDIPAEIMIQGEPGSALTALAALDDLYDWSDKIYGLPVDDDDNVVPNGPRQDQLRDEHKLFAIADRFVGPYITRASIRPGEADSSFTVIDVVFHVEFVVDNTPKSDTRAMVFTLGANANGGAIIRDPSQPFGYQQASQSDTRTQSAYAKPDTTLTIGGIPVTASFPPIVQDIPKVAGPDQSKTMVRIAVIPGSATVTASLQLQAIGYFADGSTINLTAASSWQSTNASVATVNSSGLVTKVGLGTCSITATFNGIVGASSIATA